jgi:hypothetical protein
VATLVGLRLLARARAGGLLPERLIGLGIVLMAVLGVPLCAAGRLPGLAATPPGHALFAAGVSLSAAGTACLYAFTHRVFRPGSVWAASLTAVACSALITTTLGLAVTSTQGATLAEILPHTRPWAVALVGLLGGAFAWTALESLLSYGPARRRLALGLADAVVVNRLLLWALSSASLTALCAAIAAFLLQGRAVLVDPLPTAVISLVGSAGACAWYLTFLPPSSYLRFVRARAAQGRQA